MFVRSKNRMTTIPANLQLSGAEIGTLNFGTARTSNVSHSSNVATGDHTQFTVNNNNNNNSKNNRRSENKQQAAPGNHYTMKNKPRGHCLIISNKRFENTEEVRKGTEHDVENLEETFKWLEFNVEVKENCKAEEIKKHMGKYSAMNHESFDCFVCCILSHGSSKGIAGTDGEFVSMEDIQKDFNKCKTLNGKPKLFFIQACRGEECKGAMPGAKRSATETSLQSSTGENRSHFSLKLATPDFAFAYATPPGYLSWRSVKTGSWFISCLCEVLQERADDTDLMKMLKDVRQRLSAMVTRKASEQVDVKQCSETPDTLTKKLFFNPSTEFEAQDD